MNVWKGISYFFFAMGIISLIGLINYSLSFEAFIARRTIKELDITNIDFTYGDATTGQIIISTINSGNNAKAQDVTVSKIKINNETASSWEATNSATVTKRATETFIEGILQSNYNWYCFPQPFRARGQQLFWIFCIIH